MNFTRAQAARIVVTVVVACAAAYLLFLQPARSEQASVKEQIAAVQDKPEPKVAVQPDRETLRIAKRALKPVAMKAYVSELGRRHNVAATAKPTDAGPWEVTATGGFADLVAFTAAINGVGFSDGGQIRGSGPLVSVTSVELSPKSVTMRLQPAAVS